MANLHDKQMGKKFLDSFVMEISIFVEKDELGIHQATKVEQAESRNVKKYVFLLLPGSC